MGAMDKFLDYLKLNDEDEDEYLDDNEYDYDEDDDFDDGPKKKNTVIDSKKFEEKKEQFEEEKQEKPKSNRSTTRARTKSIGGADNMEVCVIRPTSVEDAREITSTLLENKPVILNLEGIDVDVAQRIIDFTSGSCYAIDGNLQKISHYIFIITPKSVDIFGDLQDVLSGNVF